MLETLLVVACLSLLILITVPVSLPFYQRNQLDATTTQLAYTLRKASAFARSGSDDSTWGVRVDAGAHTFFKGTSYAARNTTRDEVYAIPSWLVPSGVSEIVFQK
jgi:type II secretory pathway pseudopilin PulG